MKELLTVLMLANCQNIISAQKQLFVNQPSDSVVRLDPRQQKFDFVISEILNKFRNEVPLSNLTASKIVKTDSVSCQALFFVNKVNQSERLSFKESPLRIGTMLQLNSREYEQPICTAFTNRLYEQNRTILNPYSHLIPQTIFMG